MSTIELTQAFHKGIEVSSNYEGIRTAEVIESLKVSGWELAYASQRRKHKGSVDEAYHIARLKHPDFVMPNGDRIDLVLANSHDRSSSFIVNLGVYRIVCSNGLVIGDNLLEPMYIPHKGYLTKMIPDLVDIYTLKGYTLVEESIKKLQSIEVDKREAKKIAEKAFYLKHKEDYQPSDLRQLIQPHRKEDEGRDLWSIYNVIQENLTKGSYEIVGANGKDRKAKMITSPMTDFQINKSLYDLVSEVAEVA